MVVHCDGLSDFELIRQMAEHSVDFDGARIAWGHFFVRHHQSLLLICTSDYGYLLGREGVRDLVHDTFLKAFDRAGTFDHTEVCDPPVQERKCRKWLARIAGNLLRDRFRGQPEVRMVDDEDLERLARTLDDCSSQVPVPENKRLEVLKSGFALLTETEQTVLRATMFWWHSSRNHQRMPRIAVEQLSKQVCKSPATIRQLRLRALEKLEKYVNENLPHEKAD